MKQSYKLLIAGTLIGLTSFACGGSGSSGTNANGNPSTTTRSLSGSLNLAQLSSSSAVNSSSNSSSDDWMITFRDSQNNEHQVRIDDNGSFRTELEVNQEYEIEIEHGVLQIGQLRFPLDSQNNFDSISFHLSSSSSELQFGEIECEHGVCSSTLNPRSQCDRDDDGVDDLNDDDDNRREDRDHDGRDDDDDSDDDSNSSSSSSSNSNSNSQDCELIRSKPYQNETGVNTNETIRLRFSNPIELNSITEESIQIESSDLSVPYLVSVENESEHGDIRISPVSELLNNTSYTIHISTDLSCSNSIHPAQAIDLAFVTQD